MKLALLVYIAGIVNGLSLFLSMVGFFFLAINIGLVAIMMFSNFGIKEYSWETEDQITTQKNIKDKFLKLSKYTIPLFCFMLLLCVFIPKEKTVYLMAGAYATEQIASNDRVQKIGSDVLEVIEGKLEKLKEDK